MKPQPYKTLKKLSVAICALTVVSINAWPQEPAKTEPTSAGTAASSIAASGMTTAQSGKKADRALRRKIYAAITKRKDINAGSISIVSRDGSVTLYGTVPDSAQIPQVSETVKGVPGVTSVINKLTVQRPFGQ